jgi:homoserine O-acetyltransferase
LFGYFLRQVVDRKQGKNALPNAFDVPHTHRGRTEQEATMTWPTQQGTYDAGDLTLQSGVRLPGARLSWKAHGTLSAARDNVIVYPTSYGAQHPDLEWLIGPDKILDPARWFIVIPDMFGNGLSSSPSDTPDYPTVVTIHDNVHTQRRALADLFGIDQVACVYGWSMGALQAYHWAALFPTAVQRIVVNCGVARTSVHNQVFLRSLMATLEAAPQHIGNGRFSAEPHAAKRAFGRIYAAWALSQDFYRAGLHLADGPTPNLGAPDLETFLKTDWEDRFGARPAANMYAQLRTWDAADISANDLYDGDLAAALKAIQARVLLMPGATDLYFRTADNEAELPFLATASLRPIPSIWGHRAGNPVGNPADMRFIQTEVRAHLAQ